MRIRAFAGLALAAAALSSGCAHTCCRPLIGRPCGPPIRAVGPGAPAIPVDPIPVPAAPAPATSGFGAVPIAPNGCCR